MSDQSSKPSRVRAAAEQSLARPGLAPQMRMMLRSFWASPERNKILLLGVAIVAVIGLTAVGQVRLNAWNQPFYDALSHKDFRGFLEQLLVFAVLAGGLLIRRPNSGCAKDLSVIYSMSGSSPGAPFTWSMPARWAPTPTSASTKTPAT
jgi:putative ATP-binding cassette transporter